MDDPALAFAKSVRLAGCRVINTPNLIFLCGGPTPFTRDEIDPYLSARDYFKRYIIKNWPKLSARVLNSPNKLTEALKTTGFPICSNSKRG